MILIGLCGPSGSGKTLVGGLFKMEGFAHIDCDKLVHDKVYKRADVRAAVAKHFGQDILTPEGVDRATLGSIVFADQDKLDLLNSLVRDAITEEAYKEAETAHTEYILLDAPTLFESGMNQKCAAVIGLVAPLNTCVERIMNRDGVSKQAALARLSRQKDEEFLKKNCDYLLVNDGNIVGLTKKALKLAEQIKKEIK